MRISTKLQNEINLAIEIIQQIDNSYKFRQDKKIISINHPEISTKCIVINKPNVNAFTIAKHIANATESPKLGELIFKKQISIFKPSITSAMH